MEIWINPEMYPLRQRFVLCHEIGHYALPEHRETFAYLDDETRLRPDVRDLFERQANQASIALLAQGDHLHEEADTTPITPDLSMSSRVAMRFQRGQQRAAWSKRAGKRALLPMLSAAPHQACSCLTTCIALKHSRSAFDGCQRRARRRRSSGRSRTVDPTSQCSRLARTVDPPSFQWTGTARRELSWRCSA